MSRRPYQRPVPKWWWLGQGRYTRYMIRELTCVFIGAYAGLLLVGLWRLSQGRAAFEAFLDAVQSPLGIAFHGLVLLFALYHMATWFGLTPQAMPLRVGERKVPGPAIVAAHYLVWIVVSAGVFLLARA